MHGAVQVRTVSRASNGSSRALGTAAAHTDTPGLQSHGLPKRRDGMQVADRNLIRKETDLKPPEWSQELEDDVRSVYAQYPNPWRVQVAGGG